VKKDSNFSSLTSFNNNSYGQIYNFSQSSGIIGGGALQEAMQMVD
jgi:hypothetical protein